MPPVCPCNVSCSLANIGTNVSCCFILCALRSSSFEPICSLPTLNTVFSRFSGLPLVMATPTSMARSTEIVDCGVSGIGILCSICKCLCPHSQMFKLWLVLRLRRSSDELSLSVRRMFFCVPSLASGIALATIRARQSTRADQTNRWRIKLGFDCLSAYHLQ